MDEVFNSVWDSLQHLTVEEMLANPQLLTEAFGERLDEFAAFDSLFETVTVPADIVPYRHAYAVYLDEGDEYIPEGGEIPVADPLVPSEILHANIRKRAVGLRVSWEQIQDDKRDAVKDELIAKANTVLRRKKLDALAALKAAPVNKLAVTTPWDANGDVKGDLMDAMGLILGAKDKNGDALMYNPAGIWASPLTIMDIQRSSTMKDLYVGNMASENPMFKKAGELPFLFNGTLGVIADFEIPRGEVWMFSDRAAGKLAEREPEYTSPFYAEDGGAVDLRLGKRQTARANYSHRRAFFVDHPLSVVKITGAASK